MGAVGNIFENNDARLILPRKLNGKTESQELQSWTAVSTLLDKPAAFSFAVLCIICLEYSLDKL